MATKPNTYEQPQGDEEAAHHQTDAIVGEFPAQIAVPSAKKRSADGRIVEQIFHLQTPSTILDRVPILFADIHPKLRSPQLVRDGVGSCPQIERVLDFVSSVSARLENSGLGRAHLAGVAQGDGSVLMHA